MSREEWEHDTGEDGIFGASMLEHEEYEKPMTSAVCNVQERRQQLREQTGHTEELPWLHPDNPAIWTGSIADEDE